MVSKKIFASILITAFAVFLTMGGSALAEKVELDEAKVFIEWNTTDEDQGIQFFWDSEGFTTITFTNSLSGELVVNTVGKISDQGLTETAIESVEPEESEQKLDEFFLLFPEGIYEFEGKATGGGVITGNAEFTHNLLEPVEFTKVNLPVIEWTEPELNFGGASGPATLEVVGYELVVELVVEVEVNGDEENGDADQKADDRVQNRET